MEVHRAPKWPIRPPVAGLPTPLHSASGRPIVSITLYVPCNAGHRSGLRTCVADAEDPARASDAALRAELDDARRQLAEARAELRTQRCELDRIGRERDQAVAALAFERRRLITLLERAPAFIAVARGPGHVIEYFNEAFHELSGRRALLGKPMIEAF